MDDGIFSATVLSKLPLADSAWRILHFTLADSWLEDLWDRERGRCYVKILQFSTLARLVASGTRLVRVCEPPRVLRRLGYVSTAILASCCCA